MATEQELAVRSEPGSFGSFKIELKQTELIEDSSQEDSIENFRQTPEELSECGKTQSMPKIYITPRDKSKKPEAISPTKDIFTTKPKPLLLHPHKF